MLNNVAQHTMKTRRTQMVVIFILFIHILAHAAEERAIPVTLAPLFTPPKAYAEDFGKYKSPLLFADGRAVKSAADWQKRRAGNFGLLA